MAVREVVTHPNEVLRRKARNVTEFGPDIQNLIDDMVETMREAPGVGLAAPQVDVSLRVITVEFGDEEDPDVPTKLYIVVNPEIIRPSRKTGVGTEGCLSIPGFVGDVERPETVNIKGLNRFGKPVRIKAEGWLARIFQHEVDHLNGILFIDLAEKIYQLEDEAAQVIPAD
jgi:peptide deformylase